MIGGGKFNKFDDDNLRVDQNFKSNLKKLIMENKYMDTNVKSPGFREIFKHKKFALTSLAVMLTVVSLSYYALSNRSQRLASQNELEDLVALPELSNVLGVDAMRTIAEGDAPEGVTIVGIEIENEDGAVLYRVRYSDGSYRFYNATDGSVYVKGDDSLETDESVPSGFVAGVSVQQAKDIASAKFPAKTITKIELESENGVVVYSVRFSDGSRVDVNATDGSVIRVRDASENSSSSSSSEDNSSDSEDNSRSDDSNSNDDNSGSGSDDNSGSSSGSHSGSGSSGGHGSNSNDD